MQRHLASYRSDDDGKDFSNGNAVLSAQKLEKSWGSPHAHSDQRMKESNGRGARRRLLVCCLRVAHRQLDRS